MNKTECVLECKHSVRLTVGTENATVGGMAFCRFDGWQTVETVWHMEYRVVCADCTYGRWVGQNKADAYRAVKRHAYGHPRHRCAVVYDTVTYSGGTPRNKILAECFGPVLTGVVKRSTVAPTNPAADDPPPF